jgi:transketolase N-terminal domain/subunit
MRDRRIRPLRNTTCSVSQNLAIKDIMISVHVPQMLKKAGQKKKKHRVQIVVSKCHKCQYAERRNAGRIIHDNLYTPPNARTPVLTAHRSYSSAVVSCDFWK